MIELQRTRIKIKQFAVYISDTTVTLKQGQGHQTSNDNLAHRWLKLSFCNLFTDRNPKQGYSHAKFERACCNSI